MHLLGIRGIDYNLRETRNVSMFLTCNFLVYNKSNLAIVFS